MISKNFLFLFVLALLLGTAVGAEDDGLGKPEARMLKGGKSGKSAKRARMLKGGKSGKSGKSAKRTRMLKGSKSGKASKA